jgi:hypothetical protein
MTTTMPGSRSALGICLEGYEYPYPVRFLPLSNDLQSLEMAYMDVRPDKDLNGETVPRQGVRLLLLPQRHRGVDERRIPGDRS